MHLLSSKSVIRSAEITYCVVKTQSFLQVVLLESKDLIYFGLTDISSSWMAVFACTIFG